MHKPRGMTISLALALSAAQYASAGLWDKTKKMAEDTVDAAGEMVNDAKGAVTKEKSPADIRKEIDQMASATLQRLFGRNPGAREAYEKAAGYAVFNTRKMSFMITTSFGAGVAVDRKSGKRTYMKMAGGGVNVGGGAGYYRVVFLPNPSIET